MGLLDDMVKNQFGAPLSDAIQSIVLARKEDAANETLTPIVNEFGKALQGSIIANKGVLDPAKTATLYQNYLTKIISAGGGDTQAGVRAQAGLKSIAESILSGSSQVSKQGLESAQSQQYSANANKLNAEASIMNTPAPERLRKVTASPEGTTLGQADAISAAESRYLQKETEQMRLSIGDKQKREEDARLMQGLLIKHGGKNADELPKDLVTKLANNSLSVRDIAKMIAGKGATPDDYEKAKEVVVKAYAEFSSGRSGTGTYPVDQQMLMDKYQVDAATYHQVMGNLAADPNYMVAAPATKDEMLGVEFGKAKARIAGQSPESPVVRQILEDRKRKALEQPVPSHQPSTVSPRNTTGAEAAESESFYDKLSGWMGSYGKTPQGKPKALK